MGKGVSAGVEEGSKENVQVKGSDNDGDRSVAEKEDEGEGEVEGNEEGEGEGKGEGGVEEGEGDGKTPSAADEAGEKKEGAAEEGANSDAGTPRPCEWWRGKLRAVQERSEDGVKGCCVPVCKERACFAPGSQLVTISVCSGAFL